MWKKFHVNLGVPKKDKLQALVLYASDLSTKRIAQRFCVSASAVLKGGGHLIIKAMLQN
ncbi:hypothetical protein HE1_00050 [Holospora elegans E1]|uniref:Uncharacterized protein n=1 Tax=Holospora elegans E1 TaxID=1427503 RepID=A0A023DWP8_9PROT|nr:helix-turn-helix domain-containing protein [Holospora elegans]GAJ45741.1 hypothetical protein HE1_00050 [Holospora elegans E1]